VELIRHPSLNEATMHAGFLELTEIGWPARRRGRTRARSRPDDRMDPIGRINRRIFGGGPVS
jgi:hypothetical protein